MDGFTIQPSGVAKCGIHIETGVLLVVVILAGIAAVSALRLTACSLQPGRAVGTRMVAGRVLEFST